MQKEWTLYVFMGGEGQPIRPPEDLKAIMVVKTVTPELFQCVFDNGQVWHAACDGTLRPLTREVIREWEFDNV